MSETAVVGARHYLSFTWRDAAGLPVTGGQTGIAYCARQDGSPLPLSQFGEQPAGSGAYWWAITPLLPQAHHVWLTLHHVATGRVLNLATTVYPVTPALPIPHIVGLEQEALWVILAADGTPVAGAAAALVPGSGIAPNAPDPVPVVIATPRAGAYLVRTTPTGPGYHRAELATTNQTPVQRVLWEFAAAPAGPPLPAPVSPAAGSVAWTDAAPRGVVAWTEVP